MRQISHRTQQKNYLYWPLDVLVNHVQNAQKNLGYEQIPYIREQFALVNERYRKIHPEIMGVSGFFMDVADNLNIELAKDEEYFFPYIRELVECHYENRQVSVPQFSSIGSVRQLSLLNHNTILKSLETIIEMTFTFNKFKLVDADHNKLVTSLNALEDDLQSIVHLKFDILFQRAIEMENTVGRNFKDIIYRKIS